MISLFYLIAQQTKEELGWDPTVERTRNEQYVFTIDCKRYTTKRELATFGADSMVGRGTRVYEAEDAEGKTVAIKDSWRDSSRDHEGLILKNILQDIESKLGEDELTKAKKFFVAVRVYEDVKISDKLDVTLNPGTDGIWIEIDDDRILSERLHLPSTGHIPGSGYLASPSLRRVPFPPKNEEGEIPPRVHTRIVFDDVGTPVMDVHILRDSLSCLSDAQQGERFRLHPLFLTYMMSRPEICAPGRLGTP